MSKQNNTETFYKVITMFLLFFPLILFLPLLTYGVPNQTTTLILLICVSWNFVWHLLWIKYEKVTMAAKIIILLAPICFWFDICFLGWRTYSQDICRGRMRCEFADMLFFVRNGKNTHLINKWLGETAPHWTHSHIGGSPFSLVVDGNERVNTHSIVHQYYLPRILKLLPHDNARKQVLQCVCDSQNQLRFYQGLLMVCVMEWGFPEKKTAEEWWQKHQHFFIHESDGYEAAKTVVNWRLKIEEITRKKFGLRDRGTEVEVQLRAIEYLENGYRTKEKSFVREIAEDIIKPYHPVEPQWWK
ncbi:hypothetical protein UABAM_04546 [Candidatus Uabimicrobium amorphum]|uniref:Uncharacterized protein n=1 Tax=Uabimicrobium amorphum TaxID=2596890 RepID=A0A5S9IS50_UABAM|nr:hypothetical protein [Candidatus Uabimicrobium amorphum]BBM86160.1 hypothetical protein UABAM_04546 [Candidatus Uabimicrobium amorphum]